MLGRHWYRTHLFDAPIRSAQDDLSLGREHLLNRRMHGVHTFGNGAEYSLGEVSRKGMRECRDRLVRGSRDRLVRLGAAPRSGRPRP